MAEAWGKAAGLNHEQAQALREHHKDCTTTKAALTRTSRTLESELAYLLYAMAEFSTWEEMVEDEVFQQITFRWSLVRVRKGDEGYIVRTILPAVEETANRITQAWERETDELIGPYVESKSKLHQDTWHLTQLLPKKQVLEHLRYELLGRNSFCEQEPHPHGSCAASIMETGRVRPFPREFEEGMGYRPMEL